MKTYKHVKLGWIATPDGCDYIVSDPTEIASPGCLYLNLPAELIEKSLDWQLKPSFEITAFRDEKYGNIWKLRGDGYYTKENHPPCSLQTMLDYGRSVKTGEFSIFSVIREDGIEFSLQQKTEQGEIEKFIITSENEMIAKMTNGNGYYIDSLTPAKKVILTTTDGVDIYDPEQIVWGIPKITGGQPDERRAIIHWVERPCFSTRELAEDYINKNKPKYSENQIREALKRMHITGTMGNQLIHKLNEKI